jgi:hypothetical protein
MCERVLQEIRETTGLGPATGRPFGCVPYCTDADEFSSAGDASAVGRMVSGIAVNRIDRCKRRQRERAVCATCCGAAIGDWGFRQVPCCNTQQHAVTSEEQASRVDASDFSWRLGATLAASNN